MKRTILTFIFILGSALGLNAQSVPATDEISKLLREFLAGASSNDAAIHDRFWDEDLVYTGSSGRRRGKAEIMKDVRSSPAPKPEDPKVTYTAEDIRIRQYGDTAVLAFRLVSTTLHDGKTETANFLNTGTLRKQKGLWRVVSWQATHVPRDEGIAKEELASAERAFHQAVLSADIKRLESLTDQSFVWTQDAGDQLTRQKLVDQIGSGQLKYSKLETKDVTINIYGDTGVVRGVTTRQRISPPGATASSDGTPFTAFYTLTFVYKNGGWMAVAMHSSRR